MFSVFSLWVSVIFVPVFLFHDIILHPKRGSQRLPWTSVATQLFWTSQLWKIWGMLCPQSFKLTYSLPPLVHHATMCNSETVVELHICVLYIYTQNAIYICSIKTYPGWSKPPSPKCIYMYGMLVVELTICLCSDEWRETTKQFCSYKALPWALYLVWSQNIVHVFELYYTFKNVWHMELKMFLWTVGDCSSMTKHSLLQNLDYSMDDLMFFVPMAVFGKISKTISWHL